MKIRKYIQYAIRFAAALVLAVMVGLPWQTVAPTPVSAYTEGANLFDETPVIDDLGADYVLKFPEEAGAEPKLNSFVEYSYSDNAFTRSASYGLYLYIYNPSRTKYATKTGASVINMATAYNSEGNPCEYSNLPLKVCGYTTGAYDKLFYKFRIMGLEKVFNNAVAQDEANGKRRYDVAGIQLLADGESLAIDNGISKTFYCSGYAKGCGKGAENESTLSVAVEELETVSLNVESTYYRPKGTDGESDYTQDCLHSVYFSVPNELIEKYGEMVAVTATWLPALLKPALLTANEDAYKAICSYLGVDIGERIDGLDYAYLGDSGIKTAINGNTFWSGDLGYNMPYRNGTTVGGSHEPNEVNRVLSTLYLLFPTDSFKANIADNYIVRSEIIQSEMLKSASKYGGELINGASGKYSKNIFERIDEYVTKTIERDTEYNLTSEVTTDDLWGKWFGKTETTKYSNIKAIQQINETDFTGNSSSDCDKLYISENDYLDFKTYFEANKDSGRVYLFRYRTSKYLAQEATLFHLSDEVFTSNYWENVDTNAFFFQQEVDLNFEVIDIRLKKGEVLTVIPVVMSPIDIIHDATPPVNTITDRVKTDCGDFSFLDLISGFLAVLVLLFVVWAVCKILRWVINIFRKG